MPRAPKIPAPPIPGPLKEPPPRPGESNGAGLDDHLKEAGITVVDWVDERTSLSGAARWLMFRKVPKGTNWFYTLGSATLFAFLSQAVTGVFLAMYYRPDAAGGAYESIRYVTNDVFLGQFVRGMHKWGSSVMVVLVFLHMGRVFFFGAYKYPRELNWVIGVVLLILTMVMSFTGYLLPFDQRAYWATIVGVNINGTGPLVGPYLSDFLRGGSEFGATTLSRFYAIHMLLVPGLIAALLGPYLSDFLRGGSEFGATTLSRFYAIHMLLIPGLLIALIGVHLYLVTKLGTTAPPWDKAKKPTELRESEV